MIAQVPSPLGALANGGKPAPVYPSIFISSAVGSGAGASDLTLYPPLNNPQWATKLPLPTADVLFYGNGDPERKPVISIAVEVKSVSDLCQSRDNGRLFAEQLPKMLDAHDVCRLLVYGIVRCSPRDSTALQELISFNDPSRPGTVARRWADCKLGARRAASYAYFASILDKAERLGVGTIQTPDMAHAALWIGALARSYARPYDQQTDAFRAFNRASRYPPPRYDLHDDVTKAMARKIKEEDGISWDRAYALALHFPCYLDYVNADWREIAEVRTVAASGRETRIGPVVARSIWEAQRRRRPGV